MEMKFGQALELLKQGKKVTRTGWNRREFWIEAQFPDENSKMTMPYLYMVKFNQKFPTDLSCESIMAEDWIEIE